VAYDIRKVHPYLKYDEVDFDVPVGARGDTLDRFLVRLAELRQSKRILEQCIERMPDDGPVNVDDPRVILPEKSDVYTTIEGTIQHFKLIMEGAKIPKGECYSYTEGGQRGARLLPGVRRLGHAVPRSHPPAVLPDHGGSPESSLPAACLSDVVPTFGSLNMIGGECDH